MQALGPCVEARRANVERRQPRATELRAVRCFDLVVNVGRRRLTGAQGSRPLVV